MALSDRQIESDNPRVDWDSAVSFSVGNSFPKVFDKDSYHTMKLAYVRFTLTWLHLNGLDYLGVPKGPFSWFMKISTMQLFTK